jgi:aspartyl-tRNA(Asn)/glutamyl-tRNA(Gln) amidotransferase subunit A
VEVVKAAYQRIERIEPKINAFCVLGDQEDCLKQARDAEARWRKGEPCGNLDGVPVTVKAAILARGWPTLRGSKTVDPKQSWEEDAPAVARLREAGAIVLGKTTTPEFGWKGVTDSPLSGISRKPTARFPASAATRGT